MKKLSALIALVLCVTIGGVYATWNYSRNVVDSKQASATVVVTGTQSSTKGTISITSAPKRVVIDDTNGDLKAELFFGDINSDSQPVNCDKDGVVRIVFEPASIGADADVFEHGIKMQWTLTASSVGTFDIDGDGDNDDIFNITTTTGVFNSGNPTKEAELKLGECIEFTGDITLGTYARYQAFELAISTITFTLTISEVV